MVKIGTVWANQHRNGRFYFNILPFDGNVYLKNDICLFEKDRGSKKFKTMYSPDYDKAADRDAAWKRKQYDTYG